MDRSASRKSHAQPWCPCQALHQDQDSLKPNLSVGKSMRIRLHQDKHYCHSCIQVALEQQFIMHETARKEHNQRRAWCADQINRIRSSSSPQTHVPNVATPNIHLLESFSPLQQLSEDQDTLLQLRARLSHLQSKCNTMAMDLATLSFRNEERAYKVNQHRDTIVAAQQGLHTLFTCILSSQPDAVFSEETLLTEESLGLSHVIQQSIQQARKTRFQLALQVFQMFHIDVGQEYAHLTCLSVLCEKADTEDRALQDPSIHPTTANTIQTMDETKRRRDRLLHKRIPNGIGKISGLPLPHAGPALYGVMPSGVLTSSLRLVASLTTLLAKCLGISLPHPIVLHPPRDPSYGMKEQEDIIHDRWEESNDKQQHAVRDLVTLQDVYDLGHENSEQQQQQPLDDRDARIIIPTNTSSITPKVMQSNHHPFSSTASSTLNALSISSSSILSMMKSSSNKITRSAHKVLDKMTGGYSHHPVEKMLTQDEKTKTIKQQKRVIPTMDNESVQQRLHYAISAKVCEEGYKHTHGPRSVTTFDLKPLSSSSSSSSSSSQGRMDINNNREETLKQEEHFKIALELLQNNIVALCVHSGVPVSSLWPAEAILLNLHSFMLFCRDEISSSAKE